MMRTWLQPKKLILISGVILTIVLVAISAMPTSAQGSPMHPTFPLLDAEGNNVVSSNEPVSTLETCGACHDTEFITQHNAHGEALYSGLQAPSGESVLVNSGNEAVTYLGETAGAEPNCFLCHTANPNNSARLDALAEGQLEWANTATLLGMGIVEKSEDAYLWNPDAFDETGNLLPGMIAVQDPTIDNCAQCHGTATSDSSAPLTMTVCSPQNGMTFTTGQVFAPGQIDESGVNIAGKDALTVPWDVHAERVLACTDCHYSLNNPAYSGTAQTDLDHLTFDPRQPELGEYLNRPEHLFAHSSADETGDCTTCHNPSAAHSWLPYSDRHMEAVACETCHVPRLEAPAAQSVDWTVVAATGAPLTTCRGEEAQGDQVLVTGYEPVLLTNEEGKIAPYNLATTWYWVDGQDQPIKIADVRNAYFEGDTYAQDVLTAFDANQDGLVQDAELVMNRSDQQALIATRLEAMGYDNAHIAGRIDAYPINHGVGPSETAVQDCQTCHSDETRLSAPVVVAALPPGGITPTFTSGNGAAESGDLYTGSDGTLFYQPKLDTVNGQRYVFGHSRISVIDWIGAAIFLGTLGGVVVHGGLRYFAARRNQHHAGDLEEAYMYSIYERLWHWLQTATIALLIFTGLIIHRPAMFGMFSFRGVVLVHNVVAAILLINAVLAAFYHFASGEMQQFLPRPHGLFEQMFMQARFYLQGIFRNEPHPFEKTPRCKMNPLQQMTYLGLLNVLLPLQIITGILMWGVQRWPEAAARLGGLPLLAPIHTMTAWLFAAFIVAHVYLTTTGPKPLTSIKGMIMGWEEIEPQFEAK